tara:strand:- start:20 stop:862 length:843 start_codon:yes stop_codon:yes gene_type:complete
MTVLKTINDYNAWQSKLSSNCCVGFVPTMGALHDGHLSLVKKSIDSCDVTIVSVFLNPLQFAPTEDLDTYPINIDNDLKKLSKINVDAVFIPDASEIYPKGDTFTVVENSFSKTLEGKSRPQFFIGVLTVVSKLFNIIKPQKSFFGFKDAQQYLLIKKMVHDMKYPIEIISCPTIRESNGLAMSSRNTYLSNSDRECAGVIYESLQLGEKEFNNGNVDASKIKSVVEAHLKTESIVEIDYISIISLNTFQEIQDIESDALLSLAVKINDVRLIDNIILTN